MADPTFVVRRDRLSKAGTCARQARKAANQAVSAEREPEIRAAVARSQSAFLRALAHLCHGTCADPDTFTDQITRELRAALRPPPLPLPRTPPQQERAPSP